MSLQPLKLILCLIFSIGIFTVSGQVSELEQRLKSQTGFARLETLILLADELESSSQKRSRKYAKQAFVMSTNMLEAEGEFNVSEKQLLAKGLLVFGRSQYERENYLDAKSIMEESFALFSSTDSEEGQALTKEYIEKVDSLIDNGYIKDNFINRTLKDINLNSALRNSTNNLNAGIAIKTGKLLENRGDTVGAIEHYRKAAKTMRDNGELEKAEELDNKVATLQQIQLLEKLSNLESNEVAIIDTMALQGLVPKSLTNEAIQLEDLRSKAEALEDARDFKQALTYYKEFVALQQRWERDSVEKEQQQKQALAELNRLKQESLITDLNLAAIQREAEIQVKTRNILILIASIILLFLFIMLFLYVGRRKKHKQLQVAYHDLDETKNELEEAENKISKLLQQQVSPEIASALIHEQGEKKKQFVAILFLDIRGFTPIAEKMEPKELIEYQNKVFGFMIEIVAKFHGNINQFMGDGFMATFGAPVSHGNDIRNAFLAGLEILEGINRLNSEEASLPTTSVGIGIHAGNVVTGNVGTESRKQFSVTGNTVIIAARVEQLNKVYNSNLIITDEVHQKLDSGDLKSSQFKTEETTVKGRSQPIKIHVLEAS